MPSASLEQLQSCVDELKELNKQFRSAIKELREEVRALSEAKRCAEQESIANLARCAAAGRQLRGPLHTIALIQGVLADSKQDRSTRKAAGKLKTAITSMTRMLDTMLDFASPAKAEEAGASGPAARSASQPMGQQSLCAQTLYVVDNDEVVLKAARTLLKGAGYAVKTFKSGASFIERRRSGGEDCILVSALLPDLDGFELIRRLKASGHRPRPVIVTGPGDAQTVIAAMRAGAADFVETPINADELLAAIRRALEQPVDGDMTTAWRETAVARAATLSARERQILALVLEGHPSKNIAADLGVSQRTVENHRAATMRKMGVKSLAQLVRLVLAAE